jgi:protein phosphatase PTC7
MDFDIVCCTVLILYFRQVLDDAHLLTELPGSATAVVGVLREGGRLSVANLGDCGFRVVRGSGAVVKSRPQQHEFNMPYQLAWASVLPDTDTAMDAQLYELEVAAEDVLVFGSDGLFDNMWDEQLMSIVQNFTRETARPRR